jgi:hypothetical protein
MRPRFFDFGEGAMETKGLSFFFKSFWEGGERKKGDNSIGQPLF